jgi:hypothetical protein
LGAITVSGGGNSRRRRVFSFASAARTSGSFFGDRFRSGGGVNGQLLTGAKRGLKLSLTGTVEATAHALEADLESQRRLIQPNGST